MSQDETAPATAGAARWLITDTPVSEPYPCRCHERRYDRCSPVFCPCAGRVDLDQVPPDCCAHVNTPDRVTMATAAYQLRKRGG